MQLSAAGGLPPVGWVWRRSAGGGRGPPTNGRGEAGASCTGARTEWQTARTRTGDSARTDWQTARTRPHLTAGVRSPEVLTAGLVHVSLSPPPAQRPSRPLRRGRGGGRLTPARQGGWTERTWRQTWGLERNEIYPHPAVLAPTVPSSAPLGAWLGQGRGRGRWTGLGKEEVGPPFPSLHPLPPSSRQPHPSPQGPALQTPSPPCCTPQHTLLSWESLTPSAK